MTAQADANSPTGDVTRFFRHSGVYALGSALNRVEAFLLLPVYTQFLTVSEYGTLELYYAISAVVSGVLSVGIAHATLRFYFEYDTEPERQRLVSTNLIASLLISTLGVLLAGYIGGGLLERYVPEIRSDQALNLVLATLVFELGSQVCLAYVRALERSTLFVMVALAKVLLQVLLNGALLMWFDAGVAGVLAGNLAAVMLGFLFLAGFTLWHCGFGFDRRYLLPVLKYSLPFFFSTVLGVAAANIDRFLINGLVAIEALGIFALALRFAALISDLVGEPFNRAYGAFRFTVMRRPDAASMQADIVRYLLMFLIAAGLGVIYFSADVIRILSNRDFWGAAELLPWLVAAAIINVATYPLQTGILVQKATAELFYIGLVQTVVRLAASYFLILRFGLVGACGALLLDAILGLVLTHFASQRYFRVKYDYKRLAPLLAMAAIFYLGALPLLATPGLYAFMAKVALYLLFLAAMIWSPVLDRQERAFAGGLIGRIIGAGRRRVSGA